MRRCPNTDIDPNMLTESCMHSHRTILNGKKIAIFFHVQLSTQNSVITHCRGRQRNVQKFITTFTAVVLLIKPFVR